MTIPSLPGAAGPAQGGAGMPGSGPHDPARRRWLPIVLIAVAVLLVGALGVGFLYATSVDQSVNQNLQRERVLPAETPTANGAKPRPKKAANEGTRPSTTC